jgi:hypothetical protein
VAERYEETREEGSEPAGPKPAETQQPAVESKPEASPATSVSQYVVTIDNQTGLTTKIEKLNEATGERTELDANEYAAAFAYATMGMSYSAPLSMYGAPASSQETDAIILAYYQGISDYLNALNASK